MKQIGSKIYYDNTMGNVLVDTGERSGDVIETTREQDFAAYKALSDRVQETVGCLELEYGECREDLSECNGYRVNVETLELEFSYPVPNETEPPQEPQYITPLSDRINLMESDNAGLTLELAQTQARLDQAEQDRADLLLTLVTGGVL